MTSTPVSATYKLILRKKGGGEGGEEKDMKAVKTEEELFWKRKSITKEKGQKIMSEYNQNIPFTCMKCHNETHYV